MSLNHVEKSCYTLCVAATLHVTAACEQTRPKHGEGKDQASDTYK